MSGGRRAGVPRVARATGASGSDNLAGVTNDGDTQQTTSQGKHAAPEGAGVHPLIDLDRDPNPGVPDHARPDEDDDEPTDR